MVRAVSFFKASGVVVGLIVGLGVAGSTAAQQVTQGYRTDTPLQKGMIVQLDSQDGSKVQSLAQDHEADILGVVVDAGDAPISLANPTDKQQVFVATYGQYEVLVSDQNGPIKTGDLLAVSALNGIGMKADGKQAVILGKALGAFDGKAAAESTASLRTSDGPQEVRLGRVLADVSIASNPLHSTATIKGVPSFLARAVQIVTKEPVSALRVYAALVILIVIVVVAASVLYGSIRSSMRAIGRNPLAKHSIVRSLITAVLGVLIIVIIGLSAVYLLLKL